MKHNKLAFIAYIKETAGTGIRNLTLDLMTLEPTKVVNGVQIWEKGYPSIDGLSYECQCNSTGMSNNGKWYAGRFKLEWQSADDFKTANALVRKITKTRRDSKVEDVHYHSGDSSDMLRSIAAHAVLVVYDSRFQGWIESKDIPDTRSVRAWHDVQADSGCTVHAYTPYANPSPERIRTAIKRAFCEGGYADQLIKWNNTGSEYKEILRTSHDQVGWEFSRFFWFPKTFNLAVDHTAQAEEVA